MRVQEQKGLLRNRNHVTCHVFAETAHVVAAPLRFVWSRWSLPRLNYNILSSIEIRSEISEQLWCQNLPFSITLAVVFLLQLGP